MWFGGRSGLSSVPLCRIISRDPRPEPAFFISWFSFFKVSVSDAAADQIKLEKWRLMKLRLFHLGFGATDIFIRLNPSDSVSVFYFLEEKLRPRNYVRDILCFNSDMKSIPDPAGPHVPQVATAVESCVSNFACNSWLYLAVGPKMSVAAIVKTTNAHCLHMYQYLFGIQATVLYSFQGAVQHKRCGDTFQGVNGND